MAYEVPFTLKVETPPFKTELISNEIIPRLEYEYIAKGFIFRKGRIKVTVSRVGIVKLPLKNLNFQFYMVYTLIYMTMTRLALASICCPGLQDWQQPAEYRQP